MSISETWDYMMIELRDPRVDNWLGMQSVWPTFSLCILYFLTTTVWGPRFMKGRDPFELKGVIVFYNLCQTIMSLWMFWEGWGYFITGEYSWQCEPVNYSNTDPRAVKAVNLAWWFYASKFLDLVDSLFFLARKKFSHLSLLHVVHHGSLPVMCWIGPKFLGGGQSGFAPFINSGIHALMYFYYLMASLGPRMRGYLWWKIYLTRLQMVQFLVILIHSVQPLFIKCEYPLSASLMTAFTCLQSFILFAHFYRRTYREDQHTASEQTQVMKKE